MQCFIQVHSHNFYRFKLVASYHMPTTHNIPVSAVSFEQGPNDSALWSFTKYTSYFALIQTAIKDGAGVS